MHKFFCNYNNITQKYELSQNRSFGRIISLSNTQAENTLLSEINSLLQELYAYIVLAKEKEVEENKLKILDETELLISNLYYSLFASPLELPENDKTLSDNALSKAIEIIRNLEKIINIPEYNRVASIIRNNLSSLL